MSADIVSGLIAVEGGQPTAVLVTDWGSEPAAVKQYHRGAVLIEPPVSITHSLPTQAWRNDNTGPFRPGVAIVPPGVALVRVLTTGDDRVLTTGDTRELP